MNKVFITTLAITSAILCFKAYADNHHEAQAMPDAQAVVVIEEGYIIENDSPQEMQQQPQTPHNGTQPSSDTMTSEEEIETITESDGNETNGQ